MRRFKLTGAVLIAILASACGLNPNALQSGTASGIQALDTTAIRADFNDTYSESAATNEQNARRSSTNTDKQLFRLISGAKESLEGAFYDIEDPGVVDAFVAAKKRGVVVKLVTDSDNMVDKSDPSQPRAAIAELLQAKIPVVEDKRSAIMHHKFLIVDGKTVWMGSTNLTPRSLYWHNNNALTLRSADLAGQFHEEFVRLFDKHEFGASTRQDVTPTRPVKIGTATLQVFFSPRGNGRQAVVDELKAAKRSIRFLTFSLTDEETGATMLERAKVGVYVEGVFDRWLAAGQYSLYNRFRSAGVHVYKDGNEALMHHKVILIDDSVLVSGSYNYSKNAEMNNNEAFLIVKGAPGLTKAFGQEFQRVLYAAQHNHPPAVKRSENEVTASDSP